MFGLDARIALAIFGALSVITGAALYSAIQATKVTSYITEFNELGKAYEAYMLDTGTPPPRSSVLTSHVETLNLIKNKSGIQGWKGPYLTGYIEDTDPNGSWIKPGVTEIRELRLFFYGAENKGACTATDCYIWVRIDIPLGKLDLIKVIDKKIDGEEGQIAGEFHYSKGSDFYSMLYRYNAIPYNIAF